VDRKGVKTEGVSVMIPPNIMRCAVYLYYSLHGKESERERKWERLEVAPGPVWLKNES
jgi:hypothetical protein